MEYENRLDSLEGFQILEPFDENDVRALQSPGLLFSIRESSVYQDKDRGLSLAEPEDLGFLLEEALKIQGRFFEEACEEHERLSKEFGSLYEQEMRTYVDQLIWDACVCGQPEDQEHDQETCNQRVFELAEEY